MIITGKFNCSHHIRELFITKMVLVIKNSLTGDSNMLGIIIGKFTAHMLEGSYYLLKGSPNGY